MVKNTTIVHLVQRPDEQISCTEAGPDLWEVTMCIDGVLWTSFQWGPEDRDRAEQQARRLVEVEP